MLKSLKLNKKGILGLDTVAQVVIALLTVGIIAVAAILALVSLRDSSIFDTGSLEQNQTTNIINNITEGATSFFTNVPTFFVLLGVVVLILIIAIVIVAVKGFEGNGGGGRGL